MFKTLSRAAVVLIFSIAIALMTAPPARQLLREQLLFAPGYIPPPSHPKSFDGELAAVSQTGGDETDNLPEIEFDRPIQTSALRNFYAKYSARPEIIASILRSEQKDATEHTFKGIPAGALKKRLRQDEQFIDDAKLGEQAAPGNGFFYYEEAIGRFVKGDPDKALALLDKAANCPMWDQYQNALIKGYEENTAARKGDFSACDLMFAQSAVFLSSRNSGFVADGLLLEAIAAEKRGDFEKGRHIRKTMLRLGAFVMRHGSEMTEAIAGNHMATSALATQAHKQLATSVLTYPSILERKGYKDDARNFRVQLSTRETVYAIRTACKKTIFTKHSADTQYLMCRIYGKAVLISALLVINFALLASLIYRFNPITGIGGLILLTSVCAPGMLMSNFRWGLIIFPVTLATAAFVIIKFKKPITLQMIAMSLALTVCGMLAEYLYYRNIPSFIFHSIDLLASVLITPMICWSENYPIQCFERSVTPIVILFVASYSSLGWSCFCFLNPAVWKKIKARDPEMEDYDVIATVRFCSIFGATLLSIYAWTALTVISLEPTVKAKMIGISSNQMKYVAEQNHIQWPPKE